MNLSRRWTHGSLNRFWSSCWHCLVVVSLHRPDLVRHFDRVLGLRDGHLVMDQPSGYLHPEDLQWLYQDD